MSPKARTALASVLLALLSACRSEPAPISAADREAIEQVSQRFITHLLAGQADSISALYTEDAVMMPPNAPSLHGREAIRAFVAAFPSVTEATLTNDTIVGFGDRAYVRGHFVMRFNLPGAPVDSGKFLEIRRRAADGTWLLEVDSFNSDIALPTPPTP